MKTKETMIAMLCTAGLAIAATVNSAELETPAYWMKEYPGADPVKVDRCMKVANEAYDKNVSDTAWGQNGWAVLHKGNAWEKCMDGK